MKRWQSVYNTVSFWACALLFAINMVIFTYSQFWAQPAWRAILSKQAILAAALGALGCFTHWFLSRYFR